MGINNFKQHNDQMYMKLEYISSHFESFGIKFGKCISLCKYGNWNLTFRRCVLKETSATVNSKI